jgi:surfactin family lipopeptide synthetase A
MDKNLINTQLNSISILDDNSISNNKFSTQHSEQIIKSLAYFSKSVKTYNDYWLEQLANVKPQICLPFYNAKQTSRKIKTVKIAEANYSNRVYNKYHILTAILIALFRLNNCNKFTISYRNNFLNQLPSSITKLFSEYVPLTTQFDFNWQVSKVLLTVEKQILELAANKTFCTNIIRHSSRSQYKKLFYKTISITDIDSIDHYKTSGSNVSDIALVITDKLDIHAYINELLARECPNLSYVITNIIKYVETVAAALINNKTQRVWQIPILTEEEKKQILVTWNTTTHFYPKNKTLHQLFEEQVDKTPCDIAITFKDQKLTYLELNQKANQVAHYLKANGVTTNSLVGMCVEKSLNTIISILGILKAGGAYIPLDSSYPIKRLLYIVKDSKIKTLLVTTNTLHLFSKSNKKYIPRFLILNDENNILENYNNHNPQVLHKPGDLAYVIYTSGSTGRPKGVLGTHQGIVNRCYWMWGNFPFQKDEKCCFKTSLSFVDSIWEIFGPLLQGIVLDLVPKDIEINDLPQYLSHKTISRLVVTPSLLKTLLEINNSAEFLAKIKIWSVSGEELTWDLTKKFKAQLPHAKLLNLYGSSEVAADATYCEVNSIAFDINHVPIGRPIANTQIYILDQNRMPLPVGATGEIYIGGDGLAKGYLRRIAFNKAKFIKNPFIADPTARLFKSGDMGRYLPNGNIEFLGRKDQQIKVRGFRIELGEIRSYLQKYSGIKQAVVLAKRKDDNDTIIIAYLTIEANNSFNVQACKTYLKNILPDYMIPSIFIVLEKMPLNPNDKIDNLKLLNIKVKKFDKSFTTPSAFLSKEEQDLIPLWADTLALHQEDINIHTSFFDMGGDSLNAIKLILRINTHFKINVTIKDLFNYPTIKSLAKFCRVATQYEIDHLIKDIQEQSDYPISYSQELIWVHQQFAPSIPFYNEPLIVNIYDEVNIEALEKSVNEIIKRYEIFRTNFTVKEGKIRQASHPYYTVKLVFFDLSHLDKVNREKRAAIIGTTYLKKPFKLEQDQLIRFVLVKLTETHYKLFIITHHIIFDGVVYASILIPELYSLYKNFLKTKLLSFPMPKYQYKHYAVWQRETMTKQKIAASLEYWEKQLLNMQPLKLPTNKARTKNISFKGNNQYITISKELTSKLEEISKQEGATIFMTLLAAFNILLYCYTGQDDIAIGTVMTGRNQVGIEKMLGIFFNTYILRNKIIENLNFKNFLHNVKNTVIEAFTHQDLPFNELLKNISISREDNQLLPFSVAFIFEPHIASIDPSWVPNQVEIQSDTSKFELMMILEKQNDGISGRIEYNTEIFADWFIINFIENFTALLKNLALNISEPINSILALSKLEYDKIINQWNNTQSLFPQEPIHKLFEKQVATCPNQIAVSINNQYLTYNELNIRTNKLAHYLENLNVKPNTFVAVMTERSLETIIGILGILKAHATYVPIDSDYPATKINAILADTNTPILLTTTSTYKKLDLNDVNHQAITIVFLDDDWNKIELMSDNNLPQSITKDDLAYVIYTSGSTGKPKGVMLTHQTITNLITWQTPQNSTGYQNVAQFASFSFDVSLQEIFFALLNGHTLHIIPTNVKKSITKLINFIQDKKINTLFLPPSVLGLLTYEVNTSNKTFESLNEIITAGEALVISHEIKSFFEKNNHIRLINHYGPSETHVVTAFTLPAKIDEWPYLPPIGKPIANTQVYVLNKNLQPVPINVPGELYLGGVGLAKSYINNAFLNKTKFIPNPFNDNKQAQLYRTGDIVYWLPDGNIAFVNRKDNQVKVRGFRVEIDEIEHCLLHYQPLSQCTVIAEADQFNTNRLIAYLVWKNKTDININNLKSFLKSKLPNYMIPTIFINIDQLPLDNNGKINKSSLPKPSQANYKENEIKTTEIKTDLEKKLARIWSKILAIDINSIVADSNFFDLGGHSLASLHLLSEIKKIFSVDLEPYELFSYNTLKEQSKAINSKQTSTKIKDFTSVFSPHVILLRQNHNNNIPVFLIHPVGGTVFWYTNLVKHLNCHNSIYGIQDPAIVDKNIAFNNLPEMAKFYIDLIKQIQPNGPYILGGASFGGTVAIEMANQLIQKNEKVISTILFDSWAKYPSGIKERTNFEDCFRDMHKKLIVKFIKHGLSDIKTWLDLQWHRAQLLWNYAIPHIHHKIILFKAKDPLEYFTTFNDPSNYWQTFSSSEIENHTVPGNHETIFNSPNVEILAAKLSKSLTNLVTE